MSDSASDSKVEDVLSSVRRLVSNDIPRVRKPSVPLKGALVLTDAQRIEQGAKARAMTQTLEDRIAELEAAVSKRTDEWEPDGSEDQAQHRPDRIVYTRPPTSDEKSAARTSTLRLSEIALIDTQSEDENDSTESAIDVPLRFRHDRDGHDDADSVSYGVTEAVSEAPMAEDVPVEEPRTADISAFRRPEEVMDDIDARLNLGNVDAAPAAPVFPTEEAEPDVVVDFAPPVVDTADAEHESPELTAEDSSVADQESHEELPMEDADEGSLEEVPYETDTADEDFEAALSEAVFESVPDTNADHDETEAEVAEFAADATGAALGTLLDEETLRPLVAKLIREELQGELGERITQNVRKLVRREILRSLNARELE